MVRSARSVVREGGYSHPGHRNLDSEHAQDLLEARVAVVVQRAAVAAGSLVGAEHPVPGTVQEVGVGEIPRAAVESGPGSVAAPGTAASAAPALGSVGVEAGAGLGSHHGARMDSVAVVEG